MTAGVSGCPGWRLYVVILVRASLGALAAISDGCADASGASVRRVKRADFRWLAVVPIVVAVPFLFFGLIWQALVQLAVGCALLALAFGIWMLFAED
jgi:hypothetical protein